MTTDITEQRPRSSSEVMDASLIMYRQNFWHLIAIAALCQIPLTIVSLAVIRTFFDGVAPDLYSTLQPAGAWDTTHLIG